MWISLATDGPVRRHLVLDAGGSVRGHVQVGSAARVGMIDDAGAWLIEPDAWGVESVVRYRLMYPR
jgi:hypothetical protein